jgi:hypothetical protein
MGFRDKRQNESKQIQEKDAKRHTDKIQPDRERDRDTERGTEIQREGHRYRETDIQETEKEEKNNRVLKGKNLDDAE